jgi:hypothetical protein
LLYIVVLLKGKKKIFQQSAPLSLKFSHLWIIVGFLFFSISSGKRASYLLPLLAPLTAVCTHAIATILRKQSLPAIITINRWLHSYRIGYISLFGAILVGALLFITDSRFLMSIKSTFIKEILLLHKGYLLSIPIIACLLVWWGTHTLLDNSTFFAKNSVQNRLYVLGIGSWIGLVGLFFLGTTVKNDLKGFAAQAATINQHVPAEAALYVIRKYRQEYFDPILYYLDRKVTLIHTKTALNKNEQGFPFTEQQFILAESSLTPQGNWQPKATLRQPIDVARENNSRSLTLYEVYRPPV